MAADWSETISIADLADEPTFSEEVGALIERVEGGAQRTHVVLNFARVTYLNSSNIGQLLRLHGVLTEQDRRLRLCHVRDEVWSVLIVTGLDTWFAFAPDVVTALAGLQLEEKGIRH